MCQEHKNSLQWQANATPERLRQRAALLSKVRQFFESRDIIEVETPVLSQSTVTDVHLEAMQSAHPLPERGKEQTLYLHTSPEFAMKRLLASGMSDIYQICKCFRMDEIGRLHNPEFTMLEWYRLGYSMQDLINEVGDLIQSILGLHGFKQLRYEDAFKTHLGISPLTISLKTLTECCHSYRLGEYAEQLEKQCFDETALKDALLQALFSQEIEPIIANDLPVCISHFPASQAALAKLSEDGHTALRFEFYYQQVELANGFEELCDASTQRQRFEQDNRQRKALSKPLKPIDERLIQALEHGLPDCSGVALGLDRLFMLALTCDSISDVMSFNLHRA